MTIEIKFPKEYFCLSTITWRLLWCGALHACGNEGDKVAVLVVGHRDHLPALQGLGVHGGDAHGLHHGGQGLPGGGEPVCWAAVL